MLTDNPQNQALYVLCLSDGVSPYIANVGHGGYGDSDYLPMGPQPVIRRFPNGKEVVYTIVRATHVYDSRWDSHFGEMMLDDTTVPGLQGGDIRFIDYDHPPGSSCDGAIVALTSGLPSAAVRWRPEIVHAPQLPSREAPPVIPHTHARDHAGCTTRVEGELRHIVNNGKKVLLGFHSPHQGYFKVLIPRTHWALFGAPPDQRYRVGQRVRVSGEIVWYQGDPAIYAHVPDQMECA